MAKNSFKIKNSANLTPTNPSSIVNPEPGDLIVDSTDNNRLKVFNTTSNSYEYPISSGGSGSGINPNHIINGNFDFWQRGTSATSPFTAITSDRWRTISEYTGGSTQQTRITPNISPDIKYALRVQHVTTNTSSMSEYCIRYIFERSQMRRLVNKPITLSFYLRSNKSQLKVRAANNVGSGVTGGQDTTQLFTNASIDNWQKYTFTFNLNITSFGSDSEESFSGYLDIGFQNGIQINVGDYFELAQVKLEEGDTATPFVLAGGTIEGELAACQRYYEKSYNLNVNPGTNTLLGMSSIQISQNFINNSFVRFPFFSMVRKRVTPSFVIYSPTGTFGNLHIQGVDRLATPADVSEKGFVAFKNTSGVTWSDGNTLDFHWVADAEL
jgi:hypothetical protein